MEKPVIASMEIRNRYEEKITFVPAEPVRWMDRAYTGSEVMVKRLVIVWIWSDQGFHDKKITFTVSKILKGGKISEHTCIRDIWLVSESTPEWVTALFTEHTPDGYQAAVERSAYKRQARKIANGEA